MPRKKDLTGQSFGRWIVLAESEQRKNGKVCWLCQCQCEKKTEKVVIGTDLTFGKSQSCGCLRNERVAASNSLDLIGQRFGKLTVIAKTDERRDAMIVWECQCDCGKNAFVPTSYLTAGETRSCGCLHAEVMHELCGAKLIGQKFGKLTVIQESTKKKIKKSIVWECQCECGNITHVPSHSLLSGATCSCGCIKSKGEEAIIKLLKEYNISFNTQQSFPSCRFPHSQQLAKFDFYIDNKYLLEYDGEQHFRARATGWATEENVILTQQRDLFKNDWCKEHNIPLIRIPYTHLNNLIIEDLLLETSQFIV